MLTPKQEAFCLAFSKSGNATQAYKDAGYKWKTASNAEAGASKLLARPIIAERIRELQVEINSPKILDARQMQERLSDIAAQRVEYDVVDKSGKVRKVKPTYTEALKAVETLAKMQGLFIQRQEVDIRGAIPIVIKDDVPDDS